jgi:hypothetical protein
MSVGEAAPAFKIDLEHPGHISVLGRSAKAMAATINRFLHGRL